MALLAQVSTSKVLTSFLQSQTTINIRDGFNTPGYLNLGSLTFETSSSMDSYILANNFSITGSVSSLGLLRFDGNASEMGSLFLSSIYLGNVGGTLSGQLTTDDTATNLFWNGSQLNNQGGGVGDLTTANLISTINGLGTLGYASTTFVTAEISSFSTALGTVGGGGGDLTTANLISTINGLGTLGYASTLSNVQVVSSLQIFASTGRVAILSTQQIFTSSILGNQSQFVTLSSQALFVSSLYTATRQATPMFVTF